jgi:hypothetical protein
MTFQDIIIIFYGVFPLESFRTKFFIFLKKRGKKVQAKIIHRQEMKPVCSFQYFEWIFIYHQLEVCEKKKKSFLCFVKKSVSFRIGIGKFNTL